MTVLHPILQITPPSSEQLPAVLTLDCDVVLTAGAGTGKTRTLVARVLQLLAQGVPARNIFAVTFTVKAAREMRNRLRKEITAYLAQPALEAAEHAWWDDVLVQLEAARIGTIHSLCTEILRSQPAEANVDPAFGVLDEALSLQLRTDAVAEAVAWAADDPGAVALFTRFSPDRLAELVADLFRRPAKGTAAVRGEALAAVGRSFCGRIGKGTGRRDRLSTPSTRSLSGKTPACSRVRWQAATRWRLLRRNLWRRGANSGTAWLLGDLGAALPCLARLRSAAGGSKGKAANWPTDPKPVMSAFRSAYDLRLKPLVGQVDITLDHESSAACCPCCRHVFDARPHDLPGAQAGALCAGLRRSRTTGAGLASAQS